MTRTRRRQVLKWTEEEDERLLTLISENGGNITNAFRVFAEEYPQRTPNAIQFRWYGTLKKRSTTNVCMIMLDNKHKYINGKNAPKIPNKKNNLKKNLWRKIVNLIFGKVEQCIIEQ